MTAPCNVRREQAWYRGGGIARLPRKLVLGSVANTRKPNKWWLEGGVSVSPRTRSCCPRNQHTVPFLSRHFLAYDFYPCGHKTGAKPLGITDKEIEGSEQKGKISFLIWLCLFLWQEKKGRPPSEFSSPSPCHITSSLWLIGGGIMWVIFSLRFYGRSQKRRSLEWILRVNLSAQQKWGW